MDRTRVRNAALSLSLLFSLSCSLSRLAMGRYTRLGSCSRVRVCLEQGTGKLAVISTQPLPTTPLNRPSWLRDIMFLKYCRETNSPLHALHAFHAPYFRISFLLFSDPPRFCSSTSRRTGIRCSGEVFELDFGDGTGCYTPSTLVSVSFSSLSLSIL